MHECESLIDKDGLPGQKDSLHSLKNKHCAGLDHPIRGGRSLREIRELVTYDIDYQLAQVLLTATGHG